jgi:WxcM-like, C-terminal
VFYCKSKTAILESSAASSTRRGFHKYQHMPRLIQLDTYSSKSGELSVIERLLPGNIKRIFYLHSFHELTSDTRGGHRHYRSHHALVCLHGSCKVYIHNGQEGAHFVLDHPEKCLILEPKDWREMYDFSKDAILLVISNEYFDETDYIHEPYPTSTPILAS